HLLLLDVDHSARVDDLLAIRREVVDEDVEKHVAWPGALALGLEDAAVDAAHFSFGAGLDQAVIELRNVPHLPAEDLRVEVRHFLRILRHELPMNDGSTHGGLLTWPPLVWPASGLRCRASSSASSPS